MKFVRNSLFVAVASLLILACDSSVKSSEAKAPSEAKIVPATPELGNFGLDTTAINSAIHPGDDFFRHVNGAWLDEFEIPADRVSHGADRILFERSEGQVKAIIEELSDNPQEPGSDAQKVKDYYSSILDTKKMNELGLSSIQVELDKIQNISNTQELIHQLGRAEVDATASPIGVGIEIDKSNPDRYMLSVFLGGLSLPERDYYLEDSERFADIRGKFHQHICDMLAFTGRENLKAAADAVLALETGIAHAQWPRADRRNRDLLYNPTATADLDSLYPNFNWQELLTAYGAYPADLDVNHPSAMKPAIALVNETDLQTWKDYLTYHLLVNSSHFLSEDIDVKNFEFYGEVLRGQPQQRERWKRAIAMVSNSQSLGEALGKIYVERHFPADSKRQMSELVENLRAALGERIARLDWMGEETKVEAQAKLASFLPKIGHPDKWRDFSDVEIVSGDLPGNVKRIRQYFHDEDIGRLKVKTNRDEWFMTPQTVNAYYNPRFNEIVFPAAILQAPYFDPAADPAMNYGAIGAIIGHEMGHGFDDQGSKSDSRGILRNWWTDEDRQRFDNRTKQLADQFDQYEAVPGTYVDGSYTLGENIGDLGGLAVAYEAYKLSLNGKEAPVIDGYTGDQRFFLAYGQGWRSKIREEAQLSRLKGDPHSPPEFRVNGIVPNHDAWYDAFGVTEEHALYIAPEDRIRIW